MWHGWQGWQGGKADKAGKVGKAVKMERSNHVMRQLRLRRERVPINYVI